MRNTHHGRGKGSLASHLGGKKVKEYGHNARSLFAEHAKKPEPDNVGRKMRPAAHAPKQAKVAKRARATVKRLSDKHI
jgi:ribonuclease D